MKGPPDSEISNKDTESGNHNGVSAFIVYEYSAPTYFYILHCKNVYWSMFEKKILFQSFYYKFKSVRYFVFNCGIY